MKVDISSWEMTGSSLSRRRKRPTTKEKNGGSLPSGDDFVLAQSFVRSQKRTRNHKKSRTSGIVQRGNDEMVPLLVLTGETKAVVAGLVRGKFTVSPNRQFPCQPGTSYLPTKCSANVAVVLESKLDLMYGLQAQNRRLLCWPSVSNSQEDIMSTALDGTAVSLEVMACRFPLVYGTLLDTTRKTLFLASFNQGEHKIDIKMFGVDGLPMDQESPLKHVVTYGFPESSSSSSSSGTPTGKRKATTGGHSGDLLLITQVFMDHFNLYFVNHQIYSEGRSDLSTFMRKAVTVQKVPVEQLHQREGDHVQDVVLVGALANNMILSYQTPSGGRFLVSFSTSGKVTKGPFDVGTNVRRLYSLDSRLIIGQRDNQIVAIDALSGALLQAIDMPANIQSEHWMLLGVDSNKSRIYILLEKENEYVVASAAVSLDDTVAVGPSCLAERLSQSLDSPNRIEHRETGVRRQQLDTRESGDDGYGRIASTQQGMEMLRLAYDALEEGSLDKGALASIFARAVETIARAELHISVSADAHENPQDCFEPVQTVDKRNGVINKVKLGKSAKQSLNGHVKVTMSSELHIGRNLRKLSPSMVNFVGIWAVRFLLAKNRIDTARNLVRSILRKVVRSRKASARQVFDTFGSNSFSVVLRELERQEEEEASSYSPVELLFDVFSHCKDVSERHMVHGAQYILLRAAPGDVSAYFERTQPVSEANGYRKLCDEFRKAERKSMNDSDRTLQKLSSTLVLRAEEAYLAAVLTYSDCNETLLRRAIAEYLTRGEIFALLKLVSQVRRVTARHEFNADMLKRAFLWTSTLSEHLTSPRSKDEVALLNSVKLSVSMERNATKKLLSIRHTLEAVMSDVQEAGRTDSKPDTAQNRAQLPPYQMERLIF